MSTAQLLVLAALAGFTIFLGLPLGRMSVPAPRLRAALNAGAIGVLVFLVFDILSHANEPVEDALTAATDGAGGWGRFAWLALLFPLESHRLGLMIATGIGLHNLSEGLAIGQSAANDEVRLALMLIIGFGLHNATEGFGIVAPMAGDAQRPSWAFLGLLGLIGGGPTFVGALIGNSFVNDAVFVGFLALAAGSILYVVFQLVRVAARQGHPDVVMWGIFVGLALGFATDYVLVAAGA